MEISLLGAAKEVGRSAVLLETGKSKVLLDYGVKVSDQTTPQPLYPLQVHGFLDAVLLSHAHLDHSGSLPFLFKASEPNVYTHSATVPIIQLLLEDSMKIARLRKQECFTHSNMSSMLRSMHNCEYNKPYQATPDLSFEFSDAGHILGAAMTTIHNNGRTLVYTGDYKDEPTYLHHGAKPPKKCDALIIEATYGDRVHPERKALEKQLMDDIRAVLESGGSVLLPAFAVGRSQELVMMLYRNRISPVYMDGMSRAVAEIYMDFPELCADYKTFYESMKWVNWITNPRMRDHVFNEPSVIVTTAGMLSGGPAVIYLNELHKIDKSAVFFTGYQVPGTPGHRLLNQRNFQSDEFEIDFSNTLVRYYDFSAHCDKDGLHEFIKAAKANVVIVNHGDAEQCEKLRQWVEDETGAYAFAPSLRQKFKLEEFL
jgi:putative mRNA 3-end processing factor